MAVTRQTILRTVLYSRHVKGLFSVWGHTTNTFARNKMATLVGNQKPLLSTVKRLLWSRDPVGHPAEDCPYDTLEGETELAYKGERLDWSSCRQCCWMWQYILNKQVFNNQLSCSPPDAQSIYTHSAQTPLCPSSEEGTNRKQEAIKENGRSVTTTSTT